MIKIAKIVVRKSVDEIKGTLAAMYPNRTKDKGNKFVVYKSNWVSTKLKFKTVDGQTQIKIGSDMPPRTAVIFIIGILMAFLPALIGWVIYEVIAGGFAKEVINRIQST